MASREDAVRLFRRSVERLFSISTFLLGARLLGAAAGFLVQLVLARWLPHGDLGIYFTATSLAVIGGFVAAHGYPSIATRFVSRYRRPGGAPLLRAFVGHAQRETLVLALIITVTVALSAAVWPRLEGDARTAILLAAATIPFIAAFRIYGSLAAATRFFALAYLPDVCLKPILVLCALGALLIAGLGISLVEVMLSLAAATVVLSIAQYVLLSRSFPVELAAWRAGTRPAVATRRITRKWRREAHTVLLVAVFSLFLPELSILVATPVVSTADIGIFGLCLKLAFLAGFFVQMTQHIATPDIADALNNRSDRNSNARISASATAAAGATLLVIVFTVVWGEHVLRIFGPDFAAGQTALVLLMVAQLVRAVFGPTNAVLTLVGEQRVNLLLSATAFAVLALSTLLLGALLGLNGAAAAVLLTILFWCATSAFTLHRRTGLRVDLLATYRARTAAAAARAGAPT